MYTTVHGYCGVAYKAIVDLSLPAVCNHTLNSVYSTVHSKLDYCNSLYYNLPNSQLSRLQQIQNSLARTVVKALKSRHTTPILPA